MTPRQRQVLAMLSEGLTVREVAARLGVSRNAIYQHIDALKRQGALDPGFTPTGRPAWAAASRPTMSPAVQRALRDMEADELTMMLVDYVREAQGIMREQAASIRQLTSNVEAVALEMAELREAVRLFAGWSEAEDEEF